MAAGRYRQEFILISPQGGGGENFVVKLGAPSRRVVNAGERYLGEKLLYPPMKLVGRDRKPGPKGGGGNPGTTKEWAGEIRTQK